MAGVYQVRLFDPSGTQVAIFDKWRLLSYAPKVNSLGAYTFVLNADDPRVELFAVDGILEIWRADKERGVDWYKDFEAFHMSEFEQRFEAGDRTWTSYGRGFNELLRRRIIAYRSTSSQAEKTGPGETVMKEFVDENAGPNALIVNGRLGDNNGNFPGFSIEPDGGEGSTWEGARAYKNLLETVQDVANKTGVDFNVAGIGVVAGVPQFEFQTFPGQLGEDRSKTDVNPSTGLNGAGNVPVEFSIPLGNVARMTYSLSRFDEANAVYGLGQGDDLARTVESVEDPTTVGLSPWNRKEVARNAVAQDTVAQIEDVCREWLEKLQARENFTFAPKISESTVYGRDWFLGDVVTATLRDITRSKRIIEVPINVTEDGEDIRVTFQDIP